MKPDSSHMATLVTVPMAVNHPTFREASLPWQKR